MAKHKEHSNDVKNVSPEDRISEFSEYILRHNHLDVALKELIRLIKRPPSRSLIIFLIGATRVGKTTLLNELTTKIYADFVEKGIVNSSQVFQPIMEMPAYDRFSLIDFYRLALEAMHEPLIGQKIGYERIFKTSPDGLPIISNQITKPDLRACLIKAHEYRKPPFFGIDEGSNLVNVAGVNSLQVIANIIRSLANLTKTPHLISATHDILPMLQISAQNTCRTRVVRLDRYRLDVEGAKTSISEFRSILLALALKLKLEESPNLVDQSDYFYQNSLGCIGILKEWLLEAFAATIDSGNESAENFFAICEMTRRTSKDLNNILDQISLGEHDLDLYEEEEKEKKKLAARLNMPAKARVAQAEAEKLKENEPDGNANISLKPKGRGVFRRIRRRDRTGLPNGNS